MKKILWLTSWYPNKTDRYTGDFIQRHAQAASLFSKIIVLHIVKVEVTFFKGGTFEEITNDGNLTEHILYYHCDIGWPALNRLVSLIKYISLSKKLANIYMRDKKPPDLVHVHVPIKAGLTALWIKMKYKTQYLLTEHYDIYNDVVENAFEKRTWLFKHFTKKVIKDSSVFLPVSKSLGEMICKQVLEKKYTVVFNSVDTSFFFMKENRVNRFRFVHVSGMWATKNVEGIIRSFASLVKEGKDIELLLVGPSNDYINQQVAETGLLDKNIFFTGEVTYPEVAQFMQTSSAMLMFSRTENMPCAILEALCCGLPVIATKVGGISEVVNVSNGFLVGSEDEPALKAAMIAMLDGYHKFNRAEISNQAKTQFSYEVIGKQIDGLYRTLLS